MIEHENISYFFALFYDPLHFTYKYVQHVKHKIQFLEFKYARNNVDWRGK